MQEKVSVIVPVYRVEKYLDRCVQSIVEQTYENLEIILVDDGSPDNCPRLCDEWAKKDGRIKVIHKQNGGVSSARNAALKAATGKYICFVDSDDWIEKQYVEALLNEMLCSDADLVVATYYLVGIKNKCCVELKEQKISLDDFSYENAKLLFGGHFASLSYKIYKRQIIEANNLFLNKNINYAEDAIFLYQYLSCIKNISIISEPLYNYDIGVSVATNKFWHDMEFILSERFSVQLKFIDSITADDFVKEYLKARFAWTSMAITFDKNYLYSLKKPEALQAMKRTYDKYYPYMANANKEFISKEKMPFVLSGDMEGLYKQIIKDKRKRAVRLKVRNLYISIKKRSKS